MVDVWFKSCGLRNRGSPSAYAAKPGEDTIFSQTPPPSVVRYYYCLAVARDFAIVMINDNTLQL